MESCFLGLQRTSYMFLPRLRDFINEYFMLEILYFNILSLYILRFPLWIIFRITTVVGEFINIIKTTLEFNFDLYQAFKQHGFTKTWKQREAVNQKSFSLVTCKFVTRTKAC